MKLFSESVKPTNTSSTRNILRVESYKEIFFDVFEVEINRNKYPLEKVADYNGNPVVMVPIVLEDKEMEYPFILLKGSQEIVFNENNTEIPIYLKEKNDIVDIDVGDEYEALIQEKTQKKLSFQIDKAKKQAIQFAEKAKREKLLEAHKEISEKKKVLKNVLSEARTSLVKEFHNISESLKSELFSNSQINLSELKTTIDNRIEVISENLENTLKTDLDNFSSEFDKSLKGLIREMYDRSVKPKVEEELTNIAKTIVEKVDTIDVKLVNKLKGKADIKKLKEVSEKVDIALQGNVELNDTFNKKVNKALSRIGQLDNKVSQTTLTVLEALDNKIDSAIAEIDKDYDERIQNLTEKTFDVTDEVKKYLLEVIEESRNNLVSEIRKLKDEKPIEYIIESKGKKEVKDWDKLQKEWDKKIHDKFENYKVDLRKYVSVYSSGGGTNAVQYANGGIINGDLIITGSLSAGNFTTGGTLSTLSDVSLDLPEAGETLVYANVEIAPDEYAFRWVNSQMNLNSGSLFDIREDATQDGDFLVYSPNDYGWITFNKKYLGNKWEVPTLVLNGYQTTTDSVALKLVSYEKFKDYPGAIPAGREVDINYPIWMVFDASSPTSVFRDKISGDIILRSDYIGGGGAFVGTPLYESYDSPIPAPWECTFSTPLNSTITIGENLHTVTTNGNSTSNSILVNTLSATAVKVGVGTVSAPSYSFTGDTDTGWYSGGANVLKVATGGVDRVTIGSDGKVGIGDVPSTGSHTLNVGGGFKVGTVGGEWFSVASGVVVFNSQGGTCNIGAGSPTFGARINIAPISDSTPLLSIRGSATQDILRISSPTTVTGDYVIVKSDGKVGFGTTSPTYKAEVAGSGATGGIRSHMGFDIYPVTAPDAGSVVGTVSAGGSVDSGTHYYAVTYTTSTGETTARYSAVVTTTAGNNTVTVTLPVSTDPRVTGRKIYRTKAGAANYLEYLLATIANNTATTYVDTAADSTLPGLPGVVYYKTNTTSNGISVNGTRAITVDSNGVFVGVGSGAKLTTGGRNTLVGSGAGWALTTGSDNSFFGMGAGQSQTTASTNTFIGAYAAQLNTAGSGNTALGGYALFNNQAGSSNTCIGASAGSSITGGNNTAVGRYALLYSTTGTESVALGASAGAYIASGANNTTPSASIYIGYDTRASVAGGTNEIVIGGRAVGNGSNTVTIGNDSITKTILKGNLGLGTSTPNEKLTVSGNISATGTLYVPTIQNDSGVVTINDDLTVVGQAEGSASQNLTNGTAFVTKTLGDARYCFETETAFRRFTDFTGTLNAGWMTSDVRNGGIGAAQANQSYQSNTAVMTVGVWRMDTNTATNGAAGLNGTVSILAYFTDLTFETRINPPTAPDATDNYRMVFGFCSSYAATVDPKGASVYNLCFYADKDSANWQIIENNNGTLTITDTGVAVVYGASAGYKKLTISLSGAVATFKIAGTTVGTTTLSTAMRQAIVNPVLCIAKLAGTTNRFLNCDWVRMEGNLIART